jgi:hypothetical protein
VNTYAIRLGRYWICNRGAPPWGAAGWLFRPPISTPFQVDAVCTPPPRRTIASAQRLPVRLNALFARRSKEPANASLASFASFPFLGDFPECDC